MNFPNSLYLFLIGISGLLFLNLEFNLNNNINNNQFIIANAFLSFYMIVDLYIKCYEKNYIFILHHLLYLFGLFFVLINSYSYIHYRIFVLVVSSEITNVPLKLMHMYPNIYTSLLFFISFLGYRMLYIIPQLMIIIYNSNLIFKYPIELFLIILFILLNCYWAYLIIQKAICKFIK